jgi:flagellar hook protein FlgE
MGFQQGLSGLNVSSAALEAIGNNVSNSATVGFKSARGQFADVFAASLSGSGASQIGIGASLAAVPQQFTQGNITATNNPLDVAINGGGFFRMSNNGAITYSRNGQFQLDKNGYIVNAAGNRLQGYPATYTQDPAGTIVQSTPTDLFIDPTDLQPKTTSAITLGMNLDSRMTIPNSASHPFSISDPLSYNSSTAVTTYDTLGNPHVVTMYFLKQAIPSTPPTAPAPGSNPTAPTGATGRWDMYMAVDGVLQTGSPAANVVIGGSATPGTSGSPLSGPTMPYSLYFNANGSSIAPTTSGSAFVPNFQIDLNAVLSNLGQTNTASQYMEFTLDTSTVTQFGSAFGVNNMTQDGFTSGRMAGISISADGVIQGRYSNGQSKKMGQIVLAKFNNPNGLQSLGGNQWQETSTSGAALIGAPGSGANGVVQSAAIEESNVDLTAELVNMITAQRNYQANAQTIKTQDQVMQTLVNLR